jgi:hypothetical protein
MILIGKRQRRERIGQHHSQQENARDLGAALGAGRDPAVEPKVAVIAGYPDDQWKNEKRPETAAGIDAEARLMIGKKDPRSPSEQ